MRIIVLFVLATCAVEISTAQNDKIIKLSDLAAPNSPAFILTDVSPSVIQSPNVPKQFVLGLAQSFQQSSDGFPQNYSAEFTPYWWLSSSNRSIYSLLGLNKDAIKKPEMKKYTPFSGLKFTNFSVAFLNKDLVPDTVSANQKIISIGLKSTIIKVYRKGYALRLLNKIKEWHTAAQQEMDSNAALQALLARKPSEEQHAILENFKQISTGTIVDEINKLINQKPLFSLDVAGAFAGYGVNDSIWKAGRAGVWTTLSLNLPIEFQEINTFKNYMNINGIFRYLYDNYNLDDKGAILKTNCIDIGGRIALELQDLTIGVESLYRYNNGAANTQNRTIGIINYRVANNIYINGAFGRNFNHPNKLIALFGINWGIGNEKVTLP